MAKKEGKAILGPMSSEATNFVFRQDAARRNTRRMLVLFALGIVSTAALLYLVVALSMGSFDPTIFLGVFLLVTGAVFIAALFKVFQLSHGGKTVAMALGGRPVAPESRDPDERKLRNVVEEMAIASGVPVPEIYVLDQEMSINAFAAGYSPADAAVGVTRGTIQNLNREELQGVIAHEFSHILNGDMKLNIRLISLIFGLLFLTVIGRIFLYTRPVRSRSSDGKAEVALPLIGLCLILVGGISVFFGKLIQSAVSRQREYLADASAVQFTRNPMGLAAALKKIGILSSRSYISSPQAEEAAHLFFAKGIKGFWSNIFATHPPLEKRIQLLDPSFDGDFTKLTLKSIASQTKPEPQPSEKKPPQRVFPRIPIPMAAAALSGGYETTQEAQQVLETLPPSVRGMCSDPLGAISLIYSTLLDSHPSVFQSQLAQITKTYGEQLARECNRAATELHQLSRSQKLAIVSLSTPPLRQMSPDQFETFNRLLKELVYSNEEVDLFEFCVLKNIEHNLKGHFYPHRIRLGTLGTQPLKDEISAVLSILAQTETDDPQEVITAFEKGAKHMNSEELTLQLQESPNYEVLEAALDKIATQASPATKKLIMEACNVVVASTNEQVTEEETNLVRAISLVLNPQGL
ncbi:MAG: peptidase M48 [Verrucomicrobiae bacterium]|nr:peptidase M48 [Verrucomicrobiae bacterium]